MKKRNVKFAGVAVGVTVLALPLAACGNSDASQAQQTNQDLTQQIEQAASQNGHRYPLSQMKQGGWTEEQLITEHLLRENDPNATRWVILMNLYMQPVAEWPIKGMIFDPNSSITETKDISCTGSTGNSTYACGTVDSPSDNGTYGPEAGAAAFFTTSGGEVQLPAGAIWVEADFPIQFTTKPVLTYDVNSQPTSNFGNLSKIGGK